jgi:hypothetical protein
MSKETMSIENGTFPRNAGSVADPPVILGSKKRSVLTHKVFEIYTFPVT